MRQPPYLDGRAGGKRDAQIVVPNIDVSKELVDIGDERCGFDKIGEACFGSLKRRTKIFADLANLYPHIPRPDNVSRLVAGFPSPKIAFLPIFILWFGIESLSKILLVAFACIFPVIIGTYSAARAVSRLFVWSALSLGSGRSSVFLHVILPACYPRIFTTFRIAVPVGLISTFTAEMVAGGGGMGGTLIYSQRFFESPTVFAYIVVMLAIGLLFDAAMRRFQHRFLRWAEE
jgi:ABC-type proline/glycine betaine transport system permease subunit